MKYTITGVKRTPIAKKDGTGTWNKIQVKTKQTGDQILDLGFSISKSVRDNLKPGDVIVGYVENKPWSSNGKSGFNVTLNGITAEYVYELLCKIYPEAVNVDVSGGSVAAPKPTSDGWDTAPAEEVIDMGDEGEEDGDVGF